MDEEQIHEFMTNYVGLASKEVMKVIYNIDWESVHEWKGNPHGIASDLICNLYEDFWAGHSTEDMADDLILSAYEVVTE